MFKEQRYKIESNSQLVLTIFCSDIVVVQRAKIQNWKQFTTMGLSGFVLAWLLFKEQRYKIESNSQHTSNGTKQTISCCSKSKDTKLKAIHNTYKKLRYEADVVVQRAKIQNWKQFTTMCTYLI